jgi:integrase
LVETWLILYPGSPSKPSKLALQVNQLCPEATQNQSKPGSFYASGRPLSIRLAWISKRAGVHISPHPLRRTFATLSLRAGMRPMHLQGLLGHTTLEMTRRYTQMVDDDDDD